MEIRPEIRVLIAALRAGKDSSAAFSEYCWAKSVVPIRQDDLEQRGDPLECMADYWLMAPAMASDAFDAGEDDEAIAAAFDRGLAYDRERGVLYRAMMDTEKPTPGQLIRAMSRDDQLKAAEFIGVKAVAVAVAGGEIAFR